MGTPGGCRPLKNHVPARGSPPVPFFTGRARAWKKKRLKKTCTTPMGLQPYLPRFFALCLLYLMPLYLFSYYGSSLSIFFSNHTVRFYYASFTSSPMPTFFFFNTFINSYMYGSRAMTLRVYFPPVWSVVGSGCGRERKRCFFLLSFFIYTEAISPLS